MQVQKIQNSNNYNTNFKADFVPSKSLRLFKEGLNDAERDIFESCMNTINESKDKHNYIFDYIEIGKPRIYRKIATISKINSENRIQHPPVFSDEHKNALSLFQKLAEQCAAK